MNAFLEMVWKHLKDYLARGIAKESADALKKGAQWVWEHVRDWFRAAPNSAAA